MDSQGSAQEIRMIRLVAISIGVLLALCVAGLIAGTLVAHYQYERSVESISKKLATVAVSSPHIVWDTDLHRAYDDGGLLIKNGEVTDKRKINPVGPNTQQIKVNLGNSNRPTTIEISHEDGSKSAFQAECGLVHTSFLSRDRFVMIGCNTLSVVGTNGQLLFSDSFTGKGLKFGGRASDGRRFVISVTSYQPGDPPSLTDEWLVIYDTEKQSATFALKSDPLPYQQSQTALSTDGDYLLVGSGGHVKLVKLKE